MVSGIYFSLIPQQRQVNRPLPTQGLSKVAVVVPVILSEAKNPIFNTETLRFAQNDRGHYMDFGKALACRDSVPIRVVKLISTTCGWWLWIPAFSGMTDHGWQTT